MISEFPSINPFFMTIKFSIPIKPGIDQRITTIGCQCIQDYINSVPAMPVGFSLSSITVPILRDPVIAVVVQSVNPDLRSLEVNLSKVKELTASSIIDFLKNDIVK